VFVGQIKTFGVSRKMNPDFRVDERREVDPQLLIQGKSHSIIRLCSHTKVAGDGDLLSKTIATVIGTKVESA